VNRIRAQRSTNIILAHIHGASPRGARELIRIYRATIWEGDLFHINTLSFLPNIFFQIGTLTKET
jgi:hypothetical protein